MGQVPAATYRRALECIVTFDRSGNLENIRVPTLLVAGQHDRNAPPGVMKKMAQRITGSTFIEMKGVGHLQNLEAPDDFDGLLLNFLALPERLLH
jgi:pimeloyl-ACP methyl ester carboxylesterase